MSRSTSNRPARRFAARTALVLLAIGITTHALVVRTIDTELQRQLGLHGQFVTSYVLAPALADGADPDAAAAAIVADDPQVTQVTIRDGSSQIVGRSGTRNDTDVTHRVRIPGTDLVAVVAQDDAIVQGAATDLTRRLTLVLGSGLGILWLAIVPLAYRLGRELRGQADELRAQADELREQSRELQRLLEQEHLTVQRLRELDEMRDRFLASISHELRTPMTVVSGTLQMLRSRSEHMPSETRAELVERASAKAARLDALLQALLDLSASSERPTEQSWVDVRHAVESARSALPERAVEYDLEVQGIVTNRVQLVRAVGALLGNAIRHAPGEEPVVIRSRERDGDVELLVDDTGPGIPADIREDVFEPFRQGPLLDPHSPGTGIGLSLVAAYAAQHDGRAWVSERPGGGTRVHVLLRGVVGERPADLDDHDLDDGDAIARAVVTPVVSSDRPETTPRRPPRASSPAGRGDAPE